MSDRHKYRYWDSWNAEMFESGDDLGKFFTDYELLKSGDNNPILMQSTGLRDKNDKLIFESDIVKCKGSKKVGFYTTYVVHRKQGFTLELNRTYLNNDSCMIGCEIIGNIHENPELLENQHD